MDLITIQELYTQVREMAGKIAATPQLFPTFGTSDLSGRPYIVIQEDMYYFLVNDRDTVSINRQTNSLPELLYWIFDDITFHMGVDHAINHRVTDVDPRRMIFKKQLELLQILRPEWREQKQQELQELLAKHPYRDQLKR